MAVLMQTEVKQYALAKPGGNSSFSRCLNYGGYVSVYTQSYQTALWRALHRARCPCTTGPGASTLASRLRLQRWHLSIGYNWRPLTFINGVHVMVEIRGRCIVTLKMYTSLWMKFCQIFKFRPGILISIGSWRALFRHSILALAYISTAQATNGRYVVGASPR